jgi:hypothetical protein
MILYNNNHNLDESVEMTEQIFGEPATPAHFYEKQNDFNLILEDMMSGAIPTNTKQPFNVVWKADIEALNRQNGVPFDRPYRTLSDPNGML